MPREKILSLTSQRRLGHSYGVRGKVWVCLRCRLETRKPVSGQRCYRLKGNWKEIVDA